MRSMTQPNCAHCGQPCNIPERDLQAEADYLAAASREAEAWRFQGRNTEPRPDAERRPWFCSMPCFQAYRDALHGQRGKRKDGAA